jgi:nitrilase
MNKKVAVLQMTSNDNVLDNLNVIDSILSKISKENISLAVLPENFSFMGRTEHDKLSMAEDYNNGPIQRSISKIAIKYSMWIVAGSIPIKSDNPKKCYASTIVFDDKGNIASRYDKIHLFDVRVSDTEAHKESNSTCPGNKIEIVDTPIGRIGLSICYDLRFPEMYRQLRNLKADLFIVPAAFTFDTGKAHWHTLLKARAIENLCYVLAANQAGEHKNGRTTYGHSMIISPWGDVLAECNDKETGAAISFIDLKKMKNIRQNFPCLNHRKL